MFRTGKIAAIFIAAIALLGVIVVILQLDGWLTTPWEGDSGDGANTVYIDGVPYEPRKMTNYLFIGLDQFGAVEESGSYNNTYHADFLVLLSFDHVNDTYTVLHLNRDTMTDVTELGVTSQKIGTKFEQLALAYTYGNGSHISCLNTMNTVSDMLYGLPIDYYISMSMDTVATVNDYIGGVTVVLEEDLTELNPDFVQGEQVTLNGELALQYVRARSQLSDSTNLSRMKRQRQYMDSFIKKMSQQELTDEYIDGLYQATLEYLVTNASISTLDGVFTYLKEYTYVGMQSPKGEARVGEKYMEFYIDEEQLKIIVKSWYYEERKR